MTSDRSADLPPGLPRSLVDSIRERALRVTEWVQEESRVYLHLDGPNLRAFARFDGGPDGRARVLHEDSVRSLISGSAALKAPEIIDRGPAWLLERRIDKGPVVGESAINSIVEAAKEISRFDLPTFAGRAGGSEVGRRMRGLRWPRLALESVRARQILADIDLPIVGGHGDFHAGNILISDGDLWIVDWELSGRYPAGYDLMQLWPTLIEERDRESLFDLTLGSLGAEHRVPLLQLRYVMTVRTIMNKLTASASFNRDSDGAAELIRILPRLRSEASIR